jgi:hypothetical protein
MEFQNENWAGSVVISTEGKYLTREFTVGYRPYDLRTGFQHVGIGHWRDGGTLPANRWLNKEWAMWVLKEAKVEWFSPYLERMAKGEKVPMWELAREYEIRQSEPMQIVLVPLPFGLTFEFYCCRKNYWQIEPSPSPFVQIPAKPSIRDGCWRAIIACEVAAELSSDMNYCITYYQSFHQGKPALLVQRGGRGGIYAAEMAWKDEWCREQLQQARAEWFMPFLEFMAQGGTVGMWELHREMEIRQGHPLYLLPPGIPLDEKYCEWYFKRATG